MKRWMGERRDLLGVDTETTGFHAHRGDRIRMAQLGDERHGWAVPWDAWGGVVEELLRAYDGPCVFHNAKFDMKFLEAARGPGLVEWRQVLDTRTLAWLVDPTRPTALKKLMDRYVDPRSSAMQAQLDEAIGHGGWTWATVPTDFGPYWQYAALDPVGTVLIWKHLAPALADPDVRRAYDLEVSVLPVLAGMEARGAAVDVEYAAARSCEFEDHVARLNSWTQENYGVRCGSNTQVVTRLLQMGVVLTKRTPGGALSLDKEVKDEVIAFGPSAASELVKAVKLAGQLTKMRSAYLEHFVHESAGGRIHGSINPIGAPKTGRMSISEPSLHNLPRASRENPAAIEVRNCFVSRGTGRKLAMVDWDQVELRLAAHFSCDAQLLDYVRDPSVDPFCEMASTIFMERVGKGDPRRQTTKNAAYATLYGAGPYKFSITAGISPAEGVAFLDGYYRAFPGIRALQQRVETIARRRLAEEGDAYVRTPYGHKLIAPKTKLYALVNYLIQGTAANVMKQKLVDMSCAGLDDYMVLPVHDEVILDAPAEDIGEVARKASEVMRDYDTFQAPLRAGIDGPYERWGHKYLDKDG